MLLLNFALRTIRIVLFLFGLEDTTSMISKKSSAAFVCVVDVWLCLCMVEFELSLVDVVMNCVNWQWFSEVFLSPRANILYTMMWVFNAAPPEGSKVTAIQCWFWALLLTCRDFSRFSESFDDIMDCRWWNPSIPAVGQSWETLFLNCWTICSRSCWQSGEPGSIFACEGLSLLGMLLLYPIMTQVCSFEYRFNSNSIGLGFALTYHV